MTIDEVERGVIFYGRSSEWRYIPGEFFKILDVTEDEATIVQLGRTIKSDQGSYSRYRGIYDCEMWPKERDEVGSPFKVTLDPENKYVPFIGNFPFPIDNAFVFDGEPVRWTDDTTD